MNKVKQKHGGREVRMGKNIRTTLDKLRSELKQAIIVHIALPANGGFEIIGVDCCGPEPVKDKGQAKNPTVIKNLTTEADVAYIG